MVFAENGGKGGINDSSNVCLIFLKSLLHVEVENVPTNVTVNQASLFEQRLKLHTSLWEQTAAALASVSGRSHQFSTPSLLSPLLLIFRINRANHLFLSFAKFFGSTGCHYSPKRLFVGGIILLFP